MNIASSIAARRSLSSKGCLAGSKKLDNDAMHEAAQALIGKHDFTTSARSSARRTARSARSTGSTWSAPAERISIHAEARSFLHHQVRSMTGCLALVGMGTWSPADLRAALDARDRSRLGLNAPPDGLYFVRADYPEVTR